MYELLSFHFDSVSLGGFQECLFSRSFPIDFDVQRGFEKHGLDYNLPFGFLRIPLGLIFMRILYVTQDPCIQEIAEIPDKHSYHRAIGRRVITKHTT